MLSLDDIYKKDELKLSSSQITNGLYKFGHITKKEKEYLDKADTLNSPKDNKLKKWQKSLICR